MSLRAKRSNLKNYQDVRDCFGASRLAMTILSDTLFLENDTWVITAWLVIITHTIQ